MACRGSAVRVRLAPLGFQGFEDYNLIRLVQNLLHNYLALYFWGLFVAWHGHPFPLQCPKEVQRNVFSVFYYSTYNNTSHNDEAHFTKYGQNSNLCEGKKVENSPYCSNLEL